MSINKKNLYYWPIIFFPLVLFSRTIIGGLVLFWGTPALQFIPWHSLAIDILSSGSIPLWNPYSGMGAPLAANYQSALFYPPNWIALLAGWFGGDSWLAWAHTVLISLHLVWMGLGMAHLVKRLGYGRMSQLVAGLGFGLSGFFVARAGFFSMIWAGAWLPWILFAACRITYPGQQNSANSLMGERSGFNLSLTIFMAIQLLAGHAQLTFYGWLLLGAWLVLGGWTSNRWKGIIASLENAIPAGLLAVGLAAVQLLLTAEFLLQSQRSTAVNFDLAMTYSLWPWRLVGFFLPDLFGNPGMGNYWGYASFWEDALYVGILPVILAILTIPQIWKKNSESVKKNVEKVLIRFLWITILISILFALGKNTPIFPFLFRNIPSFDMFNSPARYMLLAVFSISLLSAIGFERWKKPQKRGLYWLRLGTAGGFAITLGAFLAWYFLDDVAITFIRATALCGLFTLIAGILTLIHPGQSQTRKSSYWQLGVVVTLGIDLLLSNWNSNPLIERSFYQPTPSSEVANAINSNRLYLSPNDESFIKFGRFLQFANFDIGEDWLNLHTALIPDINILQNVSSSNNFDPMVTMRYQHWMEYLSRLPADQRKPWYNLMGVSIVENRSRFSPLGIKFEEIKGSKRFWVFGCAMNDAASQEQTWQALVANMNQQKDSYQPDVLIVEGVVTETSNCDRNIESDIQILEDQASRISLEVSSSSPGWLLIADTWYPGWSATVNQQETTVYRGNYLFRAVKIEEGINEIELIYSPPTFWIGLVASIISLMITAGIFFSERKRKQNKKD